MPLTDVSDTDQPTTMPPPPTLTPQPEVPTNFPHDPSTWTPAPPSDRVLEPWQVEDRTSYYRALQTVRAVPPPAPPSPPPTDFQQSEMQYQPPGTTIKPLASTVPLNDLTTRPINVADYGYDLQNPNSDASQQALTLAKAEAQRRAAAGASDAQTQIHYPGEEQDITRFTPLDVPTVAGQALSMPFNQYVAPHLPANIGAVPVRAPVTAGVNLAAGIAATAPLIGGLEPLTGGRAISAFFAAGGVEQLANINKQYQSGKIDGQTAIFQAVQTIPQFIGLLPDLIRVGGAGMDFLKSPEVKAAITRLQDESGKLRVPGTKEPVDYRTLDKAPQVLEPTEVGYHGTGGKFQAFDADKMDQTALYGPGVYITDNADIAKSYAETRAAQINRTSTAAYRREFGQSLGELPSGEATIQSVIPKPGLHVLNMEVAPPRSLGDYLQKLADKYDSNAYQFAADAVKAGKSGNEMYAEFKMGMQGDEIPVYEAGEILHTFNTALQDAGYDGIAHTGGIQGGAKHTVTVIFDPNNVQIATPMTRALSTIRNVGGQLIGSERGGGKIPGEPPVGPEGIPAKSPNLGIPIEVNPKAMAGMQSSVSKGIIEVDPADWAKLSPAERTFYLTHEEGHFAYDQLPFADKQELARLVQEPAIKAHLEQSGTPARPEEWFASEWAAAKTGTQGVQPWHTPTGVIDEMIARSQPPVGPEGNVPGGPAGAPANLPAPPEPVGGLSPEDARAALETTGPVEHAFGLTPEQTATIPSFDDMLARAAKGESPVQAPQALGTYDVVQGVNPEKLQAPPEGMGRRDLVGSLLERQAKNAQDVINQEADVHRTAQQVTDAAIQNGADPEFARGLGKQIRMIGQSVANEEPLNSAGSVRGWFARFQSSVSGVLPGVTGQIKRFTLDLNASLRRDSADWFNQNALKLENAVKGELPNLKFVGDARDAKLRGLSPGGDVTYAYENPKKFTGWSPETLKLMDGVKSGAPGSHWAMYRAADPRIAPNVEGNYLARVYERVRGAAETVIPRQGGEPGVAKERVFKDDLEAAAAGYRRKPMSLSELLKYQLDQTDRGLTNAVLLKSILDKVGTKEPGREGYVPLSTNAFDVGGKQWYVPSLTNNAIARAFQPASGFESAMAGVGGRLKATGVMLGDFPGLVFRLADTIRTQPVNLTAGLANHLTEMLGHPLIDTTPEGISKRTFYELLGLKLGTAGSPLAEADRGTVFGLIPGFKGIDNTVTRMQRAMNDAAWQVTLGNARITAMDGGIAMAKLFGRDMDPNSAEGIKNLRQLADSISGLSDASRGPQTATASAWQRGLFFSAQRTRAMGGQLIQPLKLLSPTASGVERMQAAQIIAGTAVSLWGAKTMAAWSTGAPQTTNFPFSWDGKKFTYNSGWDYATVGKYRIPIIGSRAMADAVAKSLTIIANEKPGDVSEAIKTGDFSGLGPKLGELAAPGAGYSLGRLVGAPRTAAALAGFGYDPNTGVTLGHLSPNQRLVNAIPFPIPASRAISKPGESGSVGGFLAGNIFGGYEKGITTKADELQALGLPSDATPKQIFDAEQQHPDIAQKYKGAVAQSATGMSAIYNKAKAIALTTQENANAQLASHGMTSAQWKDSFHATQQNLAFTRKLLGIGGAGTTSNDPKVVQDYYAIFDKYPNADSDPAQKQAMYDEIDQYQAKLGADDQKTLDQYVGFGAGTTPAVREYRDTVKQLQSAGYYDAPKKVLSTYGYEQYQSLGELESAAVDSYLKTYTSAYPNGLPNGMTEDDLRQLIANKLSGSRTIKLLALGIEKQRILDLMGSPDLTEAAIRFGLIQNSKQIEAKIREAQQTPDIGSAQLPVGP